MDIEIRDLSKSYNGKNVLDHVSYTFKDGSTTCIMAPSGQGKTTLLRILMGLEEPDSGEISGLEGRKMGVVFQEDRLCKNLSPVSNIRLVCRKNITKTEIIEAMEAVGIADCASQPARELSGGMCRRTAILRALLSEGSVLLMDEPFKGLDKDTKLRVMDYTRSKCIGRTVILVTHDEDEARYMAGQESVTVSPSGKLLLFTRSAGQWHVNGN